MLRPTGTVEAQYEVLSRLDLKPGRYNLRLAAHSSALSRSGSVYYDVDIPDFSKQALSLSGVVLNATPAIASAPRDALIALIPIVPTTQREFGGADQVTAFLRVYQGGKKPLAPVALAVRIVDGTDATVFNAAETLGSERFGATRAADYRFDVPVMRLTPGSHLLTFEVRLDTAAASRDVRFVVR